MSFTEKKEDFYKSRLEDILNHKYGDVYPNQVQTSGQIRERLENYEIVIVNLPPQWGKSSLAKIVAATYSTRWKMGSESVHVLFCSALPDRHLAEQSRLEFACLPQVVVTNGTPAGLQKSMKRIDSRIKNPLMIIDECENSSAKDKKHMEQVLKVLSEFPSYKLVLISATPYSLMQQLEESGTLLGKKAVVVNGEIPAKYYGFESLYLNSQIMQVKDVNLSYFKLRNEINREINKNPKAVHFLRMVPGKIQESVDLVRKDHPDSEVIMVGSDQGLKGVRSDEVVYSPHEALSRAKSFITSKNKYQKKVVVCYVGAFRAGVNFGELKDYLGVFLASTKATASGAFQDMGRVFGYHENKKVKLFCSAEAVDFQLLSEDYSGEYYTIKHRALKSGVKGVDNASSVGKTKDVEKYQDTEMIKIFKGSGCKDEALLQMCEDIREVAKKASLDKKQMSMPKGYPVAVRFINRNHVYGSTARQHEGSLGELSLALQAERGNTNYLKLSINRNSNKEISCVVSYFSTVSYGHNKKSNFSNEEFSKIKEKLGIPSECEDFFLVYRAKGPVRTLRDRAVFNNNTGYSSDLDFDLI